MQLLYQPKFSSFIVLRKTFFEGLPMSLTQKRGMNGGGGTVAGELSNYQFKDTHKGKSI